MYIVDVDDLGVLFEPIIRFYQPIDELDDKQGDDLSFLMDEDWGIFSERIASRNCAQELLEAILRNINPPTDQIGVRINYSDCFRRKSSSSLEDDWENRIAEVLHEMEEPAAQGSTEFDRITFAIEDVGTGYPNGTTLYRARGYKDRKRIDWFSLDEMVAPSAKNATAGRANPKGTSVLYMASDPDTAFAEVRAWKGAPVTVAEMRTTSPLRILNLTQKTFIVSPFFHDEEHPVYWVADANRLLNRFADELSRPLIPGEEEILYRPTQHLCSLVKQAGFEGIAYPSAMGPGHNIVLFNPTAATPVSLAHYKVKTIIHKTDTPKRGEPPYDYCPWTPSLGSI